MMYWKSGRVGAKEFVAQLIDAESVVCGLHFCPDGKSSMKISSGVPQFQIQDREHFFSRTLQIFDDKEQVVLSASVGWSDRCTLKFPTLSCELFWEFDGYSEDRLLQWQDTVIARFSPQPQATDYRVSVELQAPLPAPLESWPNAGLFLSSIGFYLLLYRQAESIENSDEYQKIWTEIRGLLRRLGQVLVSWLRLAWTSC